MVLRDPLQDLLHTDTDTEIFHLDVIKLYTVS